MAELEHALIQSRLLSLTEAQRRFRINAGQAWIAAPKDTLHPSKPTAVRVYPGDVVLRRARVFHGAPIGWSDLVGIDSVIVAPDMVGQAVAIFVAEEFKTPNVRLSTEQRLFGDMVVGLGGRFEVMR
jgi:hypothetical protein